MGHAALNLKMTAAEFLVWDQTQTVKHEFVRGEVFAMTGAAEGHVMLTGNLYIALRGHLKGSACRIFFTDMKLHVDAADAFFYPDLMVTCSAADAADPLVKRQPLLVVEVLSPSTAAYDATAKFAAYRQLPSLREYVLIDPQSRRSDVYRLGPNNRWELYPFEAGQDLHLAAVDLVVTHAELWDEVPEVPRTQNLG
jgi:Uma2 family endonuclease